MYLDMQFAPQKLGLADAEPIGMGNRRRVFEHPNNPNLCIKIARSEHIRAQMDERGFFYRLMPTRWRDDNWLEARAYQQEVLETADPAIWLHLPRLYGWQDTDIGPGLVFDYYRDATGGPAPTLRQALHTQGLCPDIRKALDDLHSYIRTADIWMRHPNAENTVMGMDGRLKLIDCLGTYNMQGLRHIPAVRKRRQERNIAYLERQVANLVK
jgi:hypothetical protein